MSDESEGGEGLLQFPCDFPIKAMGRDEDDLTGVVVSIVRRHVERLGEGAVTTRASSGGSYLSITVTITATSQAQLDAIYRELTDHPAVIMAL
jgi:putative lipoic acid-binding regulatory protein